VEREVVWTDALRARLGLETTEASPRPVHRRGLLADLSDLAASWPGYPLGRWALREPLEQWKALARRVARADEETRADALARGEELRATATLPLRCVLTFIFPSAGAWARADAEACLVEAGSGRAKPYAERLFRALDDPALAARLVEACMRGDPMPELGLRAVELVHALGADAAPTLGVLVAALEKERRRKTELCHVLEAVALIRSDEAAAIFAARLSGAEVKAIAGRYFRAAPALALRTLPKVAGGRTKVAEVARAVLAAVLADHPELARAAIPELGAPSRRAVAAVRDRTELRRDEASKDEIPAVLARPAWRHLDDRDLVVFEDLRIPEAGLPAPSVAERDAWADKIHWVPNSLVLSPRVALAVAHAWLHRSDDRAAAEAWLQAFPEIAAVGLVPGALRDPSHARLDAVRALRAIAARDPEAMRRALGRYEEDERAAVVAQIEGDPLHDCPFEPPKLPDFLRVDALPRPVLRASGRALPRAAARHLVEMLAFSSAETPYAGIAMVKAACEPASLDAFAWAIVEAWLAAGAPGRVAWPLAALGGIGGDDVARRLAAKIRTWPAERAMARASAGIDALARIGTDVALMHLSSFGERTRFAELRAQARARLAEAARARGLGPDDLADRIVPDLDLDPDGSMVLSFGGRSFQVGFDEHLEPLVRTRDGVVLRSLPRPGKADDGDKARAAQETWKALKDDAAAIARGQIQRLEAAMISQRRWDLATFRRVLVDHPLLVHLCRRLLLAAYDAGGALVGLFRVAEDRTFADAADAPIRFDEAKVGIPHPLEVTAEAIASWSTVFADYQLVQPFPQLGRETFLSTEAERPRVELSRFAGKEVETGKLFGLEHRGWRRGFDMEIGQIYTRDLHGGYAATFAIHPGINSTNPRETPVQTLGAIVVAKDGRPHPLGELPPVVFSELVRDLALATL
jgi:hypothetical protein